MRFRWAIFAIACSVAAPAWAEEPITIFAAASLKAPLEAIATAWAAQGHAKPRVSYDSSANLAHGIAQGAPAAIFISADEKWMDYLAHQNLLVSGSRADILTNSLVLIAPAGSSQGEVALSNNFDLAGILGAQGRLAIGEPSTVPAGIYGEQALTHLSVWNGVKDRLAPAQNVKAALLEVETGNAPAGIVYATDAKSDSKVKVIGVFPETSHDPITYPAARIAKTGESSDAAAMFAYIESADGIAVFKKYGFGVK